jgi:signal transduction histidine kinase
LRRRFAAAVAVLLATLVAVPASTAPGEETPRPTRVSSIAGLLPGDAAAKRPVRLTGTVLYSDAAWGLLFVADDSGVVFVDPLGLPEIPRPGAHIVVSGEIAFLRDGVGVRPLRIETLGESALPVAALLRDPIEADRPLCRWVTTEGVVRSASGDATRMDLRVFTPVGLLHVHLPPAPPGRDDLDDAEVRLRGVLDSTPWATTHPQLWIQSWHDLEVTRPPVPSTTLPIQTIAEVQRLWKAGTAVHRVRMRVRAVHRDSLASFLIEDETGQMRAEIALPDAVPRGYAFDLFGFVTIGGPEAVLTEAVRQKTGGTAVVEPRRDPDLPTIRTAAGIRALSREEAERGYPAQLEAVVTYVEPDATSLWVQDASAGVSIANTARRALRLAPGTRVQIEGFTGRGSVAPLLVATRVRLLGPAPLPPPRRTDPFRLLSGQDNAFRVEIEGVVRAVENGPDETSMVLATGGHRIETRLPRSGGIPSPERLVDARVRIRAVAGNRLNWRGQPQTAVLSVPRLEDIEVIRTPAADPFAAPQTAAAALFRIGVGIEWDHRRRLSGTVLFQTPDRLLYLLDATGTFSARLSRSLPTFPGEQVELVGFPMPAQRIPSLEDAVARVTARPPAPPEPVPREAGELLGGTHVGELVAVRARLVSAEPLSDGLRLQLQSAATTFDARLQTEIPLSVRYGVGSLLELSGICELRGSQDAALEILLRDVRDVRLLQPPPWWTPRRARWLIGGLATVLALASVWVVTLRRQVRRRTLQLRERMEKEAGFERHYREQLEDMVSQRTVELERAQEKLIEDERLATLGKLTATVSHELRNPLATIRGCVFLVAESLKDAASPTARRALDRAERNIERCNGIIEELLEYVRSRPLTTTRTNLDPWLQEAVREIVIPQGVTLTRDFASQAFAEIDPPRLQRCIINLVTNAVDAVAGLGNDARPSAPRIEISSRRSDDRIEISVSDSGPGIRDELRGRIFEPFFSTKGFGIGLGLAIVKQIMERHDGGVAFSSRPGETTFTLWLPATAEEPGRNGRQS